MCEPLRKKSNLQQVKDAVISHCFPSLNEQMEIIKFHNTFRCRNIARLIPNMTTHKVSHYLRHLVDTGFVEIFHKPVNGLCRYNLNKEDFNRFKGEVFESS